MSSKRKLVRPQNERMVAGVCSGFARYFSLDTSLVRILWTLLLIPGGLPGLIPYVICWFFIPSE